MSESKSVVQRGGVSFLGLLTIAFVVLKLTNVINWAWVWVLAPLWMGFALVLAVVLIGLLVAVIIAAKK